MANPTYGTAAFGAAIDLGGRVVLARAGLSYDGNGNLVWEEFWFGTEAGIDAKFSAVIAIGGKAQKVNDGGSNSLVVTYARDPSTLPDAEVPVDEWDTDTETEGVDLFAMPAAEQEAAGYVSRALYRKDIKDAVDEGEPFPLDTTNYRVGLQIYNLLSRGVTSVPFNRTILTRQRTFSATYTGKARPTARQSIWTTSELVERESIPLAIQSRLPEDPPASDTPSGTIWSWKLMLNNGRYSPATGKWVETKTWAFAAWVESFFIRNPEP